MPALNFLYGAPSFLRLVVCTTADGTSQGGKYNKGIDGLVGAEESPRRTLLDFLYAIKAAPTLPGAAVAATEVKWFERKIANDNTLLVENTSKRINIADMAEITDNTDSLYGKMECEVTCEPRDYAELLKLQTEGIPVFAIREIGKSYAVTAENKVAGFEYLFGAIADLKASEGSGEVQSYSFSVNGKKVDANGGAYYITGGETPDLDMADVNTAATGASKTITPFNEAARTILALEAADWTNLLLGLTVTKLTPATY